MLETYSFRYFDLSDFPLLEKDWKGLEFGHDMSYFQTFDWYRMLCNINNRIKDKRFSIGFASVSKENVVILIAPLWIVKKDFGKYNKKGFYFFGKSGWSDYLNFIYKEFDDLAMECLLKSLKEKFHLSDFYLENVPNNTQCFSYMHPLSDMPKTSSQVCVSLNLKGLQFEEYNKLLSKQSRQNIRTANNRLQKAGIELFYDFDDTNVNINEFIQYRKIRVDKKNQWDGKNLKWRLINFISTRLLHRGHYKFPEYSPFTDDVNSRFMTAKTADGTLCASFNYGISHDRKTVYLMGVSTNPEYVRYSPGILLMFNFIKNTITDNQYEIIDFTRGNEPYKYALGGKEHIISNFVVRI